MEETTKEQKVYNLVVELAKAQRDKRDTAKAYNEEIKRINAEIKELLVNDEDEEEKD